MKNTIQYIAVIYLLLLCSHVVAQPVRLTAIKREWYDTAGAVRLHDTTALLYKAGNNNDAAPATVYDYQLVYNCDTLLEETYLTTPAQYMFVNHFNSGGQKDTTTLYTNTGAGTAFIIGYKWVHTYDASGNADTTTEMDPAKAVRRVKRTYSGGRLMEEGIDVYNTVKGWEPARKTLHFYTGSNLVRTETWEWIGKWDTTYIQTWQYTGGQLLYVLNREKKTGTGLLDTVQFETYTYNALGHAQSYSLYWWDGPGDTQLQYSLDVYGYDAAGNRIADTTYTDDMRSGYLGQYSIYGHDYNAKSLVDTSYYQWWKVTPADSFWVLDRRYTYAYNTDNELTLDRQETWDSVARVWKKGVVATEIRYYYTAPVSNGITKATPNQGINLYPNPTNDFIILKLDNKQPATIAIYNTTGALLRQWEEMGGSTTRTIPLHGFENGNYILTVRGADGSKVSRQFVVRR